LHILDSQHVLEPGSSSWKNHVSKASFLAVVQPCQVAQLYVNAQWAPAVTALELHAEVLLETPGSRTILLHSPQKVFIHPAMEGSSPRKKPQRNKPWQPHIYKSRLEDGPARPPDGLFTSLSYLQRQ
jgi:hypothetical protein